MDSLMALWLGLYAFNVNCWLQVMKQMGVDLGDYQKHYTDSKGRRIKLRIAKPVPEGQRRTIEETHKYCVENYRETLDRLAKES
ncbi:hypothetical protein [Flexibacterium corallicola]|uniref:hypothetical protein n=1 Tax=Flexibacterium corallicola TaxID=3037259 RepID=UPI00286EFE1A|nr:hypothetical protein [Pseudovibrio sp. M1P-2-3]